MLTSLLKPSVSDGIIKNIENSFRGGLPTAVFGVSMPQKCAVTASFDFPTLTIVRDGLTAQKTAELISQISGEKAIYLPAKDDVILFKTAFNKDSLYKRLTALYELSLGAKKVVTTFEAIIQLFPKKIDYLTIKSGDEYDLYSLVEKLVKIGYKRVDFSETQGTFSLRGDILEIFPINESDAYRVDFFGDLVERIVTVNGEEKDSVTAVMATDVIIEEFEVGGIKTALNLAYKEYGNLLSKSTAKNIYAKIVEKLESDLFDDSMQYVFPLIKNSTNNVFELLRGEYRIIFDEAKITNSTLEYFYKEHCERVKSLLNKGEALSFCDNQIVKKEELFSHISAKPMLAMQSLQALIPYFSPLKTFVINSSPINRYFLKPSELYSDCLNWQITGYRVVICCGDTRYAKSVYSDLIQNKITATYLENITQNVSKINVSPKYIESGFIFHDEKLVIIGTGDITAKKQREKKVKRKRGDMFTAPVVGDFAVHDTFGVGIVKGLKKISTIEGTLEYVELEYAGGDRLYVATDQMDKLSKYLGGSEKPTLNKIGSRDFERIKERVRKSISLMTINLKKLYAERKERKGFIFSSDNALTEEFDASFGFEETEDQLLSISEIKQDMESSKVMDRLLCGDVGFGKTEVAFRACFKAIMDGKQTAIVAPTTILSEQHYQTALLRFKDFGVRISVLNRFRTPLQVKNTLLALEKGEVDLIIGTHRLFSKDVKFKDLGLLVIDEEQRFGVEHKEKLKVLKENVDTLTLSATPIPRTLHLSLSGIRDISTINTPPKERIPVQTVVTELTDSLISTAINRELARGGQAFVLYNKVDSIYGFASKIQELVKGAKVIVAHGQMPERMLENNVSAFYRQEANVLVATTIIENGIDMPKANTLIVADADTLGLSTLYQLKGRVGRSSLMAYAYFTYPQNKILTEVAYKRLTALMEFTEMGSGYKIAMRDLELRGAGSVLGKEQHGHMDKIGYELYSKLLKEELSERTKLDGLTLDIKADSHIPSSYIENESAKMDAYKLIAEISNESEAQKVRKSLTETFGTMPSSVSTLIDVALLKSIAGGVGAIKITVAMHVGKVTLANLDCLKNQKLTDALRKYNKEVTLSFDDYPQLSFASKSGKPEEFINKMVEFFSFS
ncbi:MAG: transcription-repair coupling factor [Clostridia bacterium]|nr:transcription-repair coupling factor [Clostridia bacterium]